MPSTATDRLNGLTTSVALKAPVKAVTSANVTLSGLQTIGGVVLAEGDRVLVKDQTNPVDNGIYLASTSDWTRAKDFDGNRDAVKGTLVVTDGVSTALLFYRLTTSDPVIIGTSAITFVQASEVQNPYPRTQAEIDAGVTPTNYAYPEFNVKRYGATGDGSTDDTASIQAAVDVAEILGGDVFFPRGEYKVTSQITVSSLYPVSLIGYQKGQIYNASVTGSAILIGATISGSIFKYTAPNAGLRAAHGGGIVDGIAFIDPTGSGASVGISTCTAALELNDFACSIVQNCVFEWINGSAILGEFMVMSTIKDNIIRYCGASGKPAVYLPTTSPSFPAQATGILNNRIEVCNGDSYLELGASTDSCKIIGNGFESDTATAGSNQEFMTIGGVAHVIQGNHLNRNTSSLLTLSASSCTVSGNTFQGGAYAVTAVAVTGARNSITGNAFRSTRTGYEVDISGRGNSFVGNTLYFSGAIKAGGANTTVTGNALDSLTCTTAVLGAGNDFWIQDASVACVNLSGNSLTNNGGTVSTVGGIRVLGTTPVVSGNSFDAFNGTGNGAIAIRCETSNAVITGNVEANCTTLISTTSYAGEFSANLVTGSSALPLSGSKTWDPGNLGDNAEESTTVTVAGAAVGDFVLASLSTIAASWEISAVVSAADTVSVTIVNRTGGSVDLGSGTLKARVLKR